MNPVMISSSEKHARHTVLKLNHSSNYLNIKSWNDTGQQNKGLKSENDQNILILKWEESGIPSCLHEDEGIVINLCRFCVTVQVSPARTASQPRKGYEVQEVQWRCKYKTTR